MDQCTIQHGKDDRGAPLDHVSKLKQIKLGASPGKKEEKRVEEEEQLELTR